MSSAHDVSVAPRIAVASYAYLMLGAAFIVAFSIWCAFLGRPDFPFDDAYITLHNAQALREGIDPNYGVSPLIGATSSVHLLLVAALAGVFGVSWGGAAAAWLGVGLYLSGILFVARRCALSPLGSASLLIVGAFGGMSTYHLLNGLETGLAMAAVVWALALAAGPPTRLLPGLLGIMPFVRPELALLAAPLFVRQAWLRWRSGEPRAIAGDLAVLTLCAAPWLAWLWHETAAIVPQSALGKRAFFAQDARPSLVRLLIVINAVKALTWQVGPLLLGLVILSKAPAGRVAQIFIASFVVLFAFLMPGGLHDNRNRYLYVLVPVLITGLAYLREHPAFKSARWRTVPIVAAALYATAMTPLHFREYIGDIGFTRTELESVADWVRRNLPEDAGIAVHDAGYLAFTTDHRLIDIVGLKTPNSRRVHEARTGPSGGVDRGEALAQIVLETKPAYLVVLRRWDQNFAITASLRAAGVELTPMRLDGEFQVFRLRASG